MSRVITLYNALMNTMFILIRHGETIWNRERKLMGITDIPLTAKGKRQSANIAKHLRTYPLDVIYSSPLTRTLQTAHAIYRFHPRIALIINIELRERNFGAAEGLIYEDVNIAHPELIYSETWKYRHFRPNNGESLAELELRADKFLSVVFQSFRGKRVAVVSHGTFLRVLICRILSIPLTDFSSHRIENTALIIIEHSPDRGGFIHAANYTAHLPDRIKID